MIKTILVFAGTRPEIIKMAPIIRELRAREALQKDDQEKWRVHFCWSGQHYELALPFLNYFQIEPDSQLNLMASGQSLSRLASRAAEQLGMFIEEHRDSCVALVQGDTTTAFMAALSAFYHNIPVGHVEAGLRTSNLNEPFPEEVNRRLITRLSKWHYAPTEVAKEALLREGVPPQSIVVTQNTGIDSFLWASSRADKPISSALRSVEGKRLVLVTVHRRENIGAPLKRIASALVDLANEFSDVIFVLPVHKNPQIDEGIREDLQGIQNILLIEPLDYPDLVWIMKNAELILSDSGGIQEEAASARKPVLVLRNETERPEAIAYGTSLLVGSDGNRITKLAREFLTKKRTLVLKAESNPYGDGCAAKRIIDHLLAQI
jgi:UDP-N-acetylglucosamine 2-epimerase (non-hydrolysing)